MTQTVTFPVPKGSQIKEEQIAELEKRFNVKVLCDKARNELQVEGAFNAINRFIAFAVTRQH